MVNTRKMLKAYLEPKRVELDYASVEFKVTDGGVELSLTDEQGNAGLSGYRGAGYATNKDRNLTYQPLRARGIGRDLGLYHQAFLESQAYQDGWGKIEQGLTTSHWYLQPAKSTDKTTQEYLNRQAEAVQRVLFGIEGGWSQHVREALYCLVGGFVPFLKITDGLGQLKALSMRYPSQVREWITDEYEQHWLGIKFDATGSNEPYVRYAPDLLLYQFRALGNDFEGISPMRSVLWCIDLHRLLTQLIGVAAEKYGGPFTVVERPEASYDKADDDALLAYLDDFVATENAVFLLPGGYKIVVSSPQGQMPNFDPVLRYLDEKIATVLSAEGALIGLNGKGAYNLAEIKDDQQLRSLAAYSKLICDTINEVSSSGHESLISHIVRHLTDVNGEDLSLRPEGTLPRLAWALSPEQDDTDLQTILTLFEKGVLTKTPEDEAWIREKLKVPALTSKEAP
jgi:hypothetical protein